MAQRPPRRHGNVVGWGPVVNDTCLEGEGGSCHQGCHDTNHPNPPVHVEGAKPSVDIESCYGPARGGALDTHRLDTPSGDCRGRGLFVQDTQPVDMSFSFYWPLTAGHTLGWPQPFGAPGTGHSAMGTSDKSIKGWREGKSVRGLARGTTPGQHTHLLHAIGVNALNSWAISFGPEDQDVCLLPGHQVGPGRPSQLHGNRFVWWPRLSEDTGAGGAHSISFGLTPAIPTHCFRRWTPQWNQASGPAE